DALSRGPNPTAQALSVRGAADERSPGTSAIYGFHVTDPRWTLLQEMKLADPMLMFSRALGATALVVSATFVAGCHDSDVSTAGTPPVSSTPVDPGGTLRLPPGSTPFGVGVRSRVGQPVAAHMNVLCADGGPAHISGVELKNPQGLELVDWGVRDYP